ncbi:MAG: PfkB family carbohydrate kinase [Betaproteobacteria bacterium]
MRLLCIGHSALDTIFRVAHIPREPTKVLASARMEAGGGMAANASVAAQRLGARVSYCGRVGDDDAGARILGQLRSEGVDVSRVRRVDRCTSPVATILIDDAGERLVCIYNDPALDDDASWLALDDIGSFDAVLADVRWPAGALRGFAAARAAGVPTILDGDVGDAQALRRLCAECDYAIFSSAGLAIASGVDDRDQGLHAMQAQSDAIVGVTLGELGMAWLDGSEVRIVPAPRVNAVDTLAAGDVFHAAFTLAIGEGKDVDQAARFANAAAALKCTRRGGRLGAPSRAEVDAFVATLGF